MKKLVILVGFVFLLMSCTSHSVTITYEPNGGTVYDNQLTVVVNSNSPQFEPTIPQKMNFIFAIWYVDENLTVPFTTDMLLENDSLTLYARYIAADQEDEFLVEFIAMGGTFTPNQVIPSGGLLVEPTAPIKDGYTFLYWEYVNSNSNKTGAVNFLEPITENLRLEAIYAADGSSAKR